MIGEIVSLRHYSKIHLFKSIILESNYNYISICLSNEIVLQNFFVEDPIVITHENNLIINIIGGIIENICLTNRKIDIQIDRVVIESQKRLYERFPVSLYADIIQKNSKKRDIAILKDISSFGIQIYSKVDYPVNSDIDLDIYMEKNVVLLNTTIVRKKNRINYIEYGLSINYKNSSTMSFMQEYVQSLKNEQTESINMMKHGVKWY